MEKRAQKIQHLDFGLKPKLTGQTLTRRGDDPSQAVLIDWDAPKPLTFYMRATGRARRRESRASSSPQGLVGCNSNDQFAMVNINFSVLNPNEHEIRRTVTRVFEMPAGNGMPNVPAVITLIDSHNNRRRALIAINQSLALSRAGDIIAAASLLTAAVRVLSTSPAFDQPLTVAVIADMNRMLQLLLHRNAAIQRTYTAQAMNTLGAHESQHSTGTGTGDELYATPSVALAMLSAATSMRAI